MDGREGGEGLTSKARGEGKGRRKGKRGEMWKGEILCSYHFSVGKNPEFIHVSVGTKTLVLDGSPGP